MPNPKFARKLRSESPIDSSDDDLPLRPGPSDAEIKATIRDFLKSKDLSTVTKGMVKEQLREKYDEVLVKSKKDVIAAGIEEGMQS
jgi:DEK C terminal domain